MHVSRPSGRRGAFGFTRRPLGEGVAEPRPGLRVKLVHLVRPPLPFRGRAVLLWGGRHADPPPTPPPERVFQRVVLVRGALLRPARPGRVGWATSLQHIYDQGVTFGTGSVFGPSRLASVRGPNAVGSVFSPADAGKVRGL
jgi:hypothetical protein